MLNRLSPDSDLLDAIKLDDEKAFALLFDRYWSKIYSTSNRYLKDGSASSDIVHDIFLGIWLKRAELKITSLQAYLTTAARYRVYKQLEKGKKNILKYEKDLEIHDTCLINNQADSNFIFKDLEKEVNTYLSKLPNRCREIFILSRKEHLSNDEIAIKLGISKRTVENQLTHALRQIRLSLKDVSVILLLLYGI
ncbi:RNA polymerase sigma-70 factor [Pedobacter sp. P351]|uniref:RNA polymerase sigma-70 factor n=1 Tax=Pedobacter superstes TaxID=3133441 RepID=UPI0030AA94BE